MAFCGYCGGENTSLTSFCEQCGHPIKAGSASPPPIPERGSLEFPVLPQLMSVIVSCSLFSYLFWPVLSIPGRMLGYVVPWIDCSGNTVGSLTMFLCSFTYAFTRIIGPLALTAILLFARHRIKDCSGNFLRKIPSRYRFAVPPLAATAVFEITWSFAHIETSNFSGILPQTVFPMVAGLFCFLGLSYTAPLQEKFDGFLSARDKLPKYILFTTALAIPVLFAISITSTLTDQDKANKEQSVTLLGLACGYFAMVPRRRLEETGRGELT